MRRLITWRRGRDPEAGSVLVFWGVAIVVLLGMVALSFDVGRISATQSELQSYADNLAVAAAAELDGEDDSIDRAIAAAATLITDSQTFGAGGRALGAADYRLEFLTRTQVLIDEPEDTVDPATGLAVPGAYTVSEQVSARYVRAVVGPRNVGTPFAAVLSLITGDALVSTDVGAQAMAGLDEYACDITPLFFCVPPTWDASQNVGRQILLRAGGGASWAAGNFGFLDPTNVNPGGPCAGMNQNTSQLFGCLVAAEYGKTGCFKQSGVNTQPGQGQGRSASPFNVFFDIYDATMNQEQKDPDYPPAPNVIKGIAPKNNACKQFEDVASIPLPLDRCFVDSTTCLDTDGRFGDRGWARSTYIDTNHAGIDPVTPDTGVSYALPAPFNGTRYEMYQAEIRRNQLNVPGESGAPICGAGASTDINRRVLTAAAINCGSQAIGGNTEDVQVQEFVRIFLTNPIGYNYESNSPPTSGFDLYVEVLGTAEEETAIGPALIRKVVRLVE